MSTNRRPCPHCLGTQEECGCGTGRCDHCADGTVAGYPLYQKKYVTRYLSPQSVEKLARYWSDPTRDETLGQFIARVAEQAVSEYKMALHRQCPTGDKLTLMFYQRTLPQEIEADERNAIWEEKQKASAHAIKSQDQGGAE